MTSGSAFDQVLENVRAALHARRSELSARAEAITRALQVYVTAAEADIARGFAAEHGLKQPRPAGPQAREAAHALLQLVEALPELQQQQRVTEPPEPTSQPPATLPPEAVPTELGPWPLLGAAVSRAPLVVVGGVSKREHLVDVPESLRSGLEWIDTTRQGTHAIGNLQRRIRDGRLTALVVLEQVISHRHSDPLLSAARQVGLPCVYAGKGGKGAILRALSEVEAVLRKQL